MPDDRTTGRVTIALVEQMFHELRRWPTPKEVEAAVTRTAVHEQTDDTRQRDLRPEGPPA